MATLIKRFNNSAIKYLTANHPGFVEVGENIMKTVWDQMSENARKTFQSTWANGGTWPIPKEYTGTKYKMAYDRKFAGTENSWSKLGTFLDIYLRLSTDLGPLRPFYEVAYSRTPPPDEIEAAQRDAVKLGIMKWIRANFPDYDRETGSVRSKQSSSGFRAPKAPRSTMPSMPSSMAELFGGGAAVSDSDDTVEEEETDYTVEESGGAFFGGDTPSQVKEDVKTVETIVQTAEEAMKKKDAGTLTDVSDYTLSYQKQLNKKLNAALVLELIDEETYDFLYKALSELCQFARNNPRSRHNPRRNRRGRL
jgi:hypothetical protein